MLIFVSLLAFYLAWNLGANDVANSMGTAVGSKAITLRQALAIAAILELAGAILFGQNVSTTLTTELIHPERFTEPHLFILGMVAVILTGGIWLNLATGLGLPVSSSHAVVGAIAGFAWVAVGSSAIDWQTMGWITISWLLTPVISGAIAFLFYRLLQVVILTRSDRSAAFAEWFPWLNAIVLAAFGWLILPTVAQPIHQWLQTQMIWTIPTHTIAIGIGMMLFFVLNWIIYGIINRMLGTMPSNHRVDSSKPDELEPYFIPFQILSACFVAFSHGANDVGNAIAPLAAIVVTNATGTIPVTGFDLPLWVLLLGGVGIVAGLAVWGGKVIATVGEGIIPLQPSSGFCAQLGAALTVLAASQLGLPVSTSHAIVGGVVGIGCVTGLASIQGKTVRDILAVWIVTIPAAIALSSALFWLLTKGWNFIS
jgi:inorganic phosphate transporter, PiT family